MRLPDTAHTSHPWRIHELTPDFVLQDVWALATPGGPHELPRLLSRFSASTFPDDAPPVVRFLWRARWRIGALLGWDRPDAGVGTRVPSLRERLPGDLRDAPAGPRMAPFTPLYLIEDEWAAEMANRTVHSVMHISWVSNGSGGHRGQLAVLVRPNGMLGRAYMAAIKPFRRLFVYPALLRDFERGWSA